MYRIISNFMTFSRALFYGGILFLGLGARGGTVLVGDAHDPAGLPGAIEQAHRQGATDITIRPGTYDLPWMKSADTIGLDHWSKVMIHAPGVTLIFEGVGQRPLHLRGCTEVTWDGGTFRFAHPACTQGRIVALGSDAQGGYCDWKIDAGYATDFNLKWAAMDVVDPATRLLKVNTGDWNPTRAVPLGQGTFRLYYAAGGKPNFALHDWLVTRSAGGSSLIQVDGCGGCTIENTIFENGGFGAFWETGGAGGNHYWHCRIQPGPRPPGATEDQLIGCGADGFHSVNTDMGPDIEDCVFTGVFLDDCIAIHGTFAQVVQAKGDQVTFSDRPFGGVKVGDPLRIANMKGFFGVATATAVQPVANGEIQVKLDHDLQVPIDWAETDPHKGTKVSNPLHCGQGYKILRCQLGDTRSRGILVKADNGLIDGCTIRGCGMSGVSIGPEFWWNEAGYSWQVTVSHNTFIDCNKNNGEQAAIWIHGDGALGNRAIAIRDNSFQRCYGESVIDANWVDGLEITRNRVDRSFEAELARPGNVIAFQQARHVKLLDNVVTNQGPFAGDLVGMDGSVTRDDVEHDDSVGIRVSSGNP